MCCNVVAREGRQIEVHRFVRHRFGATGASVCEVLLFF